MPRGSGAARAATVTPSSETPGIGEGEERQDEEFHVGVECLFEARDERRPVACG